MVPKGENVINTPPPNWRYLVLGLQELSFELCNRYLTNCLQSRPNQDKFARIPLVVTYHPILPNLQSITRCHLSTLHTSERLREAFLLSPLIVFRWLKNLMDFLVRATLTTNNQEPPGNHPCGVLGCKTCPILTASDEFTSHTTGLVYKMNFCHLLQVLQYYSSNNLQDVWPTICGWDWTAATPQGQQPSP